MPSSGLKDKEIINQYRASIYESHCGVHSCEFDFFYFLMISVIKLSYNLKLRCVSCILSTRGLNVGHKRRMNVLLLILYMRLVQIKFLIDQIHNFYLISLCSKMFVYGAWTFLYEEHLCAVKCKCTLKLLGIIWID